MSGLAPGDEIVKLRARVENLRKIGKATRDALELWAVAAGFTFQHAAAHPVDMVLSMQVQHLDERMRTEGQFTELEEAARAYIKAHRGMVVRLQDATAKHLESLVLDDQGKQ